MKRRSIVGIISTLLVLSGMTGLLEAVTLRRRCCKTRKYVCFSPLKKKNMGLIDEKGPKADFANRDPLDTFIASYECDASTIPTQFQDEPSVKRDKWYKEYREPKRLLSSEMKRELVDEFPAFEPTEDLYDPRNAPLSSLKPQKNLFKKDSWSKSAQKRDEEFFEMRQELDDKAFSFKPQEHSYETKKSKKIDKNKIIEDSPIDNWKAYLEHDEEPINPNKELDELEGRIKSYEQLLSKSPDAKAENEKKQKNREKELSFEEEDEEFDDFEKEKFEDDDGYEVGKDLFEDESQDQEFKSWIKTRRKRLYEKEYLPQRRIFSRDEEDEGYLHKCIKRKAVEAEPADAELFNEVTAPADEAHPLIPHSCTRLCMSPTSSPMQPTSSPIIYPSAQTSFPVVPTPMYNSQIVAQQQLQAAAMQIQSQAQMAQMQAQAQIAQMQSQAQMAQMQSQAQVAQMQAQATQMQMQHYPQGVSSYQGNNFAPRRNPSSKTELTQLLIELSAGGPDTLQRLIYLIDCEFAIIDQLLAGEKGYAIERTVKDRNIAVYQSNPQVEVAFKSIINLASKLAKRIIEHRQQIESKTRNNNEKKQYLIALKKIIERYYRMVQRMQFSSRSYA